MQGADQSRAQEDPRRAIQANSFEQKEKAHWQRIGFLGSRKINPTFNRSPHEANAVVGVVLKLPTNRQKKYAAERAKGKNKKAAALAAGYSESTALRTNRIETPNFRAAFSHLIRKNIPAQKIAKRISEGLDAMETKFFAKDGIVVDQRDVIDWAERRQYAQLAAEFGDLVVPKRPAEAGSGVNIQINFQRDPMPGEVVIPEKPSV